MNNYFTDKQLSFFQNIKNGILSDYSITQTIEELTNNNPVKLKALNDDFFIFVEIQKVNFTKSDIKIALKEYKKNKKKIPYLEVDNEKFLDIDKLLYPNGLFFCNKFIDLINKLIELNTKANSSNKNVKKEVYETLWFKVGLLFATGEIQKLLKKNNSNFTEVARQLGNKSYRVYITATSYNVLEKGKQDKNIYSDQKKMQIIKKYCDDNKIEVCEDFLKKIIPVEPGK